METAVFEGRVSSRFCLVSRETNKVMGKDLRHSMLKAFSVLQNRHERAPQQMQSKSSSKGEKPKKSGKNVSKAKHLEKTNLAPISKPRKQKKRSATESREKNTTIQVDQSGKERKISIGEVCVQINW